jgi:short-subunit dehydrogenase
MARSRASFRNSYGPWALVAGGSEGLGAELARGLATRGLNLVLLARRAEPLAAMALELEQQHGVEVRPMAMDLADGAALSTLLDALVALEIGLLVCNAALSPIGEFLELAPDAHARMLAVNCQAATILVRRLAPAMVGRGRGGIVLVSSMASLQGTALVAHYSATKAYLRVLAEGLWQELRPKGVDVLACCAGPVDTPAYRKEAPAELSWLALPPLPPARVAEETLRALGRQPVVFPGLGPGVAAFVSQRILPRRAAIALAAAGTRSMYKGRGAPPTPGG